MWLRSALLAVVALSAAMFQAQAQDHVHREPGSEAPPAQASRVERIRLSTGVELEVVQAGPPRGTPVLFLHGYPDSGYSFARVLERLPSDVHAIVPTQRGHGSSERPACCYRVDDFAADAVALLDALGVEQATFVGHSMGSFVAQRVAIDHPERVARLVLVSSADVPGTRPLRELESTVRALSDPIDIGFVRQFQESTVAAPVPDAFMDRVVAESARVPARVWRDVLRGLIEMDARRELPRIVAPTLLISGEKDELFVRADQEALARSVEGARLVVYAGVGHAPHWEQPERFVNDLEGFLSSAVPLPEGLGVWHRPITTASPRAQRYFDQGLALTYAFNHVEAVRSFGEALRLDPDCAMCYWGIAYALGPNINTPMEPDAEARALEAARSLRGQA